MEQSEYPDLPTGAEVVQDASPPGPRVEFISPQDLSAEMPQSQTPDYAGEQRQQGAEHAVFDVVKHLSDSPELYYIAGQGQEDGYSDLSAGSPAQGQPEEEEESAGSDQARREEAASVDDDQRPEEDGSSADSGQRSGEGSIGEGEIGDLPAQDAADSGDELNEPDAAQKHSKAEEARARAKARDKARKEVAARREALLSAARKPRVLDLTEIPRVGGPSGFRSEPETASSGFGTQPGQTLFRDPTKDEVKQYIASVAKLYDVPPGLAMAVAHHESGGTFDIRVERANKKRGRIRSYDYGAMQVNSRTVDPLEGPTHVFGMPTDTDRFKRDWKYNVNVGMAMLSRAYRAAKFNLATRSAEEIARETYAHYNSPAVWRRLYTRPHEQVAHNVDNFVRSWHVYNH